MTRAEFDAWLPRAILEYAQGHVVDGRWSEDEAVEKSRAEHSRLLPQGLETPEHHLWTITRSSDRKAVGLLWVHMMETPRPHVFVYDIEVYLHWRAEASGAIPFRLIDRCET